MKIQKVWLVTTGPIGARVASAVSRKLAIAKAKEFAEINPGVSYAVFELLGTYKIEDVLDRRITHHVAE